MDMAQRESDLTPLFKALADKNRLRIIGLLAGRPHAVEELSRALALGASTVSHHLSVLSRAGLVSAAARGYYSIYALQSAPLQEMAKRLLRSGELRGLAAETGADAFENKVLATFTSADGTIKGFPAQEKKFLVLVRYVLKEFQPGVRYTEKHVNTILGRFSKDTARLRRALVDYHYMEREGGGGKYWRVEGPSARR